MPGRERGGAGAGTGWGWAGAETEEKRIGPDPTNDKGNQSVWEGSGRRTALFPPSALWSQGSVRGQERDL